MIAGFPKYFGQRHRTLQQVPAVSLAVFVGSHVTDARLMIVQPRQQRSSRRTASGRIVKLTESESVLRQGIKMGCLYLAAIAAQVRKTQVVSHDQHNIGPLVAGLPGLAGGLAGKQT